MLSWTWAALIIVGFGVLGAATPLLIGMFYPTRSLAVMAIKRRLKASSFGPHQFSEACLQELADMSIRDAKIFGNLSRKGWRSELGQMADNTADIVGWIVLVEGDCSAEKIKSNASMGGCRLADFGQARQAVQPRSFAILAGQQCPTAPGNRCCQTSTI
jgi:hypothetical protein